MLADDERPMERLPTIIALCSCLAVPLLTQDVASPSQLHPQRIETVGGRVLEGRVVNQGDVGLTNQNQG